MERLWSPWRSRHIASAHAPGDLSDTFKRIAESEDDAENLVVARGESTFVVMNLYPYNNGHLLIVPYRKVASYEELTTEEQNEIARMTERCIRWLRKALTPEGFNVGMNLGKAGGAGIPEHLHVHVVPRWQGDTNFMPALGEVKVISEGLQDTYRKLRAAVDTDDTA